MVDIDDLYYDVDKLPYTDPALKTQMLIMLDYMKELNDKISILNERLDDGLRTPMDSK